MQDPTAGPNRRTQPQANANRTVFRHLKCYFAALLTVVTPVSGPAIRSMLLISSR